ncbi:MAG: hypothetical protein INR64_08895, partial [Caulobacteraceae bacterium]|nr:hypothetical protein [Caulobacter sp.]
APARRRAAHPSDARPRRDPRRAGRAARLLKAERRGKEVFYVVADRHVADMLHNMIEHAGEHHAPHPEEDR